MQAKELVRGLCCRQEGERSQSPPPYVPNPSKILENDTTIKICDDPCYVVIAVLGLLRFKIITKALFTTVVFRFFVFVRWIEE